MAINEESQEEVSWLDVFEEVGYWVEPLAPHIAKYLEVDTAHMAIFYCDPAVLEIKNSDVELAGVVCFFEGSVVYGRIDAYGQTNLARLDRAQRKILRELGILFQMRLNPRGPFLNLYV